MMIRHGLIIVLMAALVSGLPLDSGQAGEQERPIQPAAAEFDQLLDLFTTSMLEEDTSGESTDLSEVMALRGGHHGHHHRKSLTEDQKLELGKLMAGNMGRLMILHAELHVTKDQKTKMKAAFQGHREAMKGKAKAICNAIRKLDDVTSNDESNASINKAIAQLGEAFAAATLEFLHAAHDARKVLSKDQQKSIQRTTVAMVKAHEDFEKKTGICPFAAMMRAKHAKGHHHYRKHHHHHKHSSKSHSEKRSAFKRMMIGNLGRLMVLYADLNINPEQRDSIKTSIREHAKNMKPRLISVKGNMKPLVISITSDQSPQDLQKVAKGMGHSIAQVAMEITQARRDIRKVLTLEQKNKIAKTRGEIRKSLQEFRNKMKKSKSQPKI